MLGLHWEELLRETYLNASMVVIVILIPHREPVARLPRSSDLFPLLSWDLMLVMCPLVSQLPHS